MNQKYLKNRTRKRSEKIFCSSGILSKKKKVEERIVFREFLKTPQKIHVPFIKVKNANNRDKNFLSGTFESRRTIDRLSRDGIRNPFQ